MHKFITRISAFFLRRSHKLENLTYLSIWLLVIVLYLVEAMRISGMDMYYILGWKTISMMAVKLAPFILLFAFNNWVLMPRLLFRNHISGYFLALFTTIFVMWGWQYYYQQTDLDSNSAIYLDNPSGSLLSMRAMLNGIYSFLIAGINIAIALIFRMIDDRIEHERVMKSNAQEQLSYLRAQINPHFYMNMLNNIHGMIEINPVQAQEMVLEMSHLMRYMLYDSSQQVISLSSEIDFLENYIHIMRQRFPTEKVRISTDFPSIQKCKGVRIPPLLFLVFLENAFKHGIS
ncbi:MAG: histidine kinase, partial [Muribaculaceae bacterium]|nr:histidine kinase [Muribaculaceae bacterium]